MTHSELQFFPLQPLRPASCQDTRQGLLDTPPVSFFSRRHMDYDSMKPYIALTDKTRKKMMETNF